jgi:transposase
MDIQEWIDTYKGKRTSSYPSKMLLKVLKYSYTMKIYSSGKISKALKADIPLMWISGKSRPDLRTINNFRSGRMQRVIEAENARENAVYGERVFGRIWRIHRIDK